MYYIILYICMRSVVAIFFRKYIYTSTHNYYYILYIIFHIYYVLYILYFIYIMYYIYIYICVLEFPSFAPYISGWKKEIQYIYVSKLSFWKIGYRFATEYLVAADLLSLVAAGLLIVSLLPCCWHRVFGSSRLTFLYYNLFLFWIALLQREIIEARCLIFFYY